MKRKALVLPVCALFAVCCVVIGVYRVANAAPPRLVYIYGGWSGESAEKPRVEPEQTTVGRGTLVIWVNDSEADVILSFTKGRECEKATSAAVGWKVKEGCYITAESLPPKGTASAVFEDIGTYEYDLVFVDKDVTAKGAITVRSTLGTYPR